MWILFAFLSAIFAALTSILAKLGMEGIDSNLGTAIRTVVVLIMAWGIVLITGKHHGIENITTKKAIMKRNVIGNTEVFISSSLDAVEPIAP